MKLYNTMTRQKEEFKPLGKTVKYYTCGPTVWDYAHIGNIRSFVFADILKRYLKWKGFSVEHVMNITDVDDRLIEQVNKTGKSLNEITSFYEKAFFEDLDRMNIDLDYKKTPRATESIKDMVEIIKTLLVKGIAYKKDDGIYFDITQFPEYGKLANIDLSNLKSGARVAQDKYDKDNPQDFALWKFYKEEDGDVYWETDIGKGRPGWHIECSGMSTSNLGETIDIHTGGIDLLFPHHTNEVAQSEAATEKQFVRYWVHSEHLMVDGKKMSKSLGNFYTLKDLVEKGYDPRVLRLFFLMSHYRSQLNLTTESLDATKGGLERIDDFVSTLKNQDGKDNDNVLVITEAFIKEWETLMDDDLNTPETVALMFEYIKSINKEIENGISKENADEVLGAMKRVDGVFAILQEEKEMPETAQDLIDKRNDARSNKDFDESDRLRKELESIGIEVRDERDKSYYRVK